MRITDQEFCELMFTIIDNKGIEIKSEDPYTRTLRVYLPRYSEAHSRKLIKAELRRQGLRK